MSARIAEWPPIEAWITAPDPNGRGRIVESVALRDGRVVPAETDPADLYPWWAPAAGTRAHAVQRVARAVTAALVPVLAGLVFAAVVLLAPAGEWAAEQLIRGWGW